MIKNLKRVSVTIVIPVRNEEDSIITNLRLIKKQVKIPHNIIIVDGCSMDQTFSLVSTYTKSNKNVKIICTSPKKSGFKDSLDIGIDAAKTEFIVVMMGDLCDDPKTINKMYEEIQNGSDIVVASRYMSGGGKIGEPKFQGLISRAVSKTLHFLTNIPTHDVSNPFRMYRKKLLNSIKTESRGNEIPIEVIYKAHMAGAKITEVPTIWRGRESGKSKFRQLKVVPGYAKVCLWVLLNHK
ncbi:MAG: hypothetical protein UR81_C0036G0004 [Candidatus Levybacteria bacterium GW2011_GWB1_35_5]|nr:MAG: hypothetical protein UR81_C0036G0004 [Candidatus Levybacteria bacterium GW2011_GWB1_35_5]